MAKKANPKGTRGPLADGDARSQGAKEAAVRMQQARIRVQADVEELKQESKRQSRLPPRESLVTLALDVYKLSLDQVKEYCDRHGNTTSSPQPDFRAACEALRVASNLCGYDKVLPPGLQKPGTEAAHVVAEPELDEAEVAADAEAALEKLRSKLVKRLPTPGSG